MTETSSGPTAFKRVGLVGKTDQENLKPALGRLMAILEAHGVELVFQGMLQPGSLLEPEVEGIRFRRPQSRRRAFCRGDIRCVGQLL